VQNERELRLRGADGLHSGIAGCEVEDDQEDADYREYVAGDECPYRMRPRSCAGLMSSTSRTSASTQASHSGGGPTPPARARRQLAAASRACSPEEERREEHGTGDGQRVTGNAGQLEHRHGQ